MPRLSPENQAILDAFSIYLETERRLSRSSIRVYRQLVSAVINKHIVDLEDQPGLTSYYLSLCDTSPAQAHLLASAWSNFESYMLSQRGIVIPTLKDAHNAGPVEAQLPIEAIYDLHSALIKMPLTRLIELRWGEVQKHSDGHFEVHTRDQRDRATAYPISEKGVVALQQLYSWGYRTAAPVATSRVITVIPDSDAPIGRQTLALKLRQEEARRRSAMVALPLVPIRSLADLVRPVAQAEQHSGVSKISERERASLQAMLREREEPSQELAAALSKTPEGITEAVKLEKYREWRAQFPIDDERELVLRDTVALASWTDEQTLLRWRCTRWETEQCNDFGPPPAGIVLRIITQVVKPFVPPVTTMKFDDAWAAKLVEAVDSGAYEMISDIERKAYEAFKAAQSSSPQVATDTGSNVSTGGGADSLGKS